LNAPVFFSRLIAAQDFEHDFPQPRFTSAVFAKNFIPHAHVRSTIPIAIFLS
jgi:hypothetical protein